MARSYHARTSESSVPVEGTLSRYQVRWNSVQRAAAKVCGIRRPCPSAGERAGRAGGPASDTAEFSRFCSRMRPFSAASSARREAEGSIKGSIPTARWRTCKFSPSRKRRFPALLQSPLTDSNRRPPPYHADPAATRRSPRQRFWLVSAVMEAAGFATGCHGLRPRGSIKAPSSVVRSGYNGW